MRKYLKKGAVAVGSGLSVLAGAASAQTGIDTTEILAAVQDAETKGLAIATAVTVMLFLFAASKYIRRAK